MEIDAEFNRTPFVDALAQLPPQFMIFEKGKKKLLAGELYKKSVALAVGLRSRGFHEGDRLVLIVPPGREFLEIFFAANFLKGTISIIDPEMGRDNFESKLRQFDPHWMFIDSRLLFLREQVWLRYLYLTFFKRSFYFSFRKRANVVASGRRLPLFGKFIRHHRLYRQLPVEITFRDKGDYEFIITYTSGTLAEPKGVVHTMNSLLKSLEKIREVLSSAQKVRIAAYLPHFLLFGICSGNAVFLFDKHKSTSWTIGFIERKEITTLFGPPSFYLPLIQQCKEKLQLLPSCLQLVILGSAPVHPGFLTSLYEVVPSKAKVICLYGMTENLIVATIDGRDKIKDEHPGDVVGTPIEGTTLSIAADGEILLQSSQLFARYLHLESRETPHYTGDLGYLAPDGTLVLNGRKKDMIIRRDTNIYPAVYERTIKNIPGIDEAVMIGVYSKAKEDEEVFLIVESKVLSEQKLMGMLQTGKYSIDREALPDKILFRKIPHSGRQNKIDRKALRAELTT